MAYLVSQMRKEKTPQSKYMTDITQTLNQSTILSPNTFGLATSFEDFALEGTFDPSQVYYLRFRIHKIPQFFYSGTRTRSEMHLYQNAENLTLQILLKNEDANEDDEEKFPPEVIGTCSVPVALQNSFNEYSSYSFVFKPSKFFNRLGFRIYRVSYDAIVGGRDWLRTGNQYIEEERQVYYSPDIEERKIVKAIGSRIDWNGEFGDVCILNNIIPANSNWLKIGYQCRPGSLIVINGEPIQLGRSGIYELNNGTLIEQFMIAAPGGSNNDKIDAFLLDYAYKDQN